MEQLHNTLNGATYGDSEIAVSGHSDAPMELGPEKGTLIPRDRSQFSVDRPTLCLGRKKIDTTRTRHSSAGIDLVSQKHVKKSNIWRKYAVFLYVSLKL